MSDQELAALAGAAEIVTTSEQTEASEATENTEGQVSDQPAEGENPEDKTKSQVRRERREQQRQREQQEAAETARKLADAEARLGRIKAAAQAIQEPKESDFTDSFEFVAAKAAFQAHKMAAKMHENEVQGEITAAEQARQQADLARAQERQRDYVEAIPEARARYADFDQVISVAMRSDVVSPAVADMVLDSERPHDLAYHLGKNPDVARAISQLNAVQAARELGRIEAQISLPRAQPTTAPAPIRPVRGASSATPNPDNMTADEFAAWRAKGGTFKT